MLNALHSQYMCSNFVKRGTEADDWVITSSCASVSFFIMTGIVSPFSVQWLTCTYRCRPVIRNGCCVRRSVTVQWTFCFQSLDGGLTSESVSFCKN